MARIGYRLDGEGVPGAFEVIREEPRSEGFAGACVELLRDGPRWEPARDLRGNALSVDLTFRCHFRFR